MTDCGHKILVVAHSPMLASALVAWLSDSQTDLVLANSYPGGKAQLLAHPDLLIAEVKLGEYNGLHLALRGQAAGIPTIVLGPNGFEDEAERLGAVYLSLDGLGPDDLAFAIEKVLDKEQIPSLPLWRTTDIGEVLH
jgi:CheY-like chemotaxis protein